MRKKLLTMALLLVAAVGVSALFWTPAAEAAGCGCPRVCCKNCDGSFAYCANSYAFCPECAAP